MLSLQKCSYNLKGCAPSFCVQDKQLGNTGSVRHVARRVPRIALGRIAGITANITGITITSASAAITAADLVARVRRDHHPIVIGSEGPDQHIHIVFHPSCQVTPDGLGYGSNGSVKIKVGIGVLEMVEDAGEQTPKQAAAPLFNKLASSLGTILQARHHVGKEA